MTDQEFKAVELTIQTPGWAVIVGIAKERILNAKNTALWCTDESEFLEKYRKAHAAQNALYEFLHEVEKPQAGEPSE